MAAPIVPRMKDGYRGSLNAMLRQAVPVTVACSPELQS